MSAVFVLRESKVDGESADGSGGVMCRFHRVCVTQRKLITEYVQSPIIKQPVELSNVPQNLTHHGTLQVYMYEQDLPVRPESFFS